MAARKKTIQKKTQSKKKAPKKSVVKKVRVSKPYKVEDNAQVGVQEADIKPDVISSEPVVETYKPFQPGGEPITIPSEEMPMPVPSTSPEPPMASVPAPAVDQPSLPQPQILAPVDVAEPASKTVVDTLEPEFEDIDTEVPLEKNNKRIYIIRVGVFVVVVVLLGGVLYVRTKMNTQTSGNAPEVVSEVTSTPQSVEVVEVVPREKISLEILNGSGIAGKAGKTAEVFKGLGYEISSTGNAAKTEGNKLYISDSVEENVLANLLEDVKKELGIDSITEKLKDLDVTARIIIGE